MEERGVYLEFVDFSEIISRLTTPPIFLNDLDPTTRESRERIAHLVRTNYDGDSLAILPSCECGETTGEVNKNTRCPKCGTIVTSVTEKPIESTVWFRAPRGVDTLMNPNMWGILKDAFTSSGLSILDWLTMPSYMPPVAKQGEVERLQSFGLRRGYNWFCRNFDHVMDVLFSNGFYRGTPANRGYIADLLHQNRHLMFTHYLPIPAKIAFITEKTSVGTYADSAMASAMDAVLTICSIDESEDGTTQQVRENRTIRAINQLESYYSQQYRGTIGKKEGLLRKHRFGTRVPYGGRAVISSLSHRHDYDELHIPWTYAIALLKVHVTNKLLKMGWTPIKINKHLINCANRYDETLDSIFKLLIEESPHKGIPAILQRNPSLARGSAQCFYITKVKTDPAINTISMSVLCLKSPNADSTISGSLHW